ncbi:N-acetylmuramoyl-L-alanine amidase [Psychroflexus sp. CAK1W]|uniref:N-acetylmuramoyl-L-alanine amidase family protein n=1 Tax=Psychroflexus curvus TaxID=2873595 RepID=UPI001CC9C54B|nr:N-acetylmuramoyl-L-alanine amidase [Psychroflexus curvus]MBZ9626899.1 N-acetylmuramoyl-L-alanine amidase [Psychroflexus curvus]
MFRPNSRLRLLLLAFLVTFCFNFMYSQTNPNKFVVVIDAGHGGEDAGNTGNNYYEKDIALKIALKVGKQLEKYEGLDVLYTRKTDVFIPLNKRAEIANKSNADLFVSIHCNGVRNQAPSGTETFILGLHRNKDNLEIAMKENSVIKFEEDYEVKYDGFDPNSPESYIGFTIMQEEFLDQSALLANFVQKQFSSTMTLKDRGVKQAGFLVLRETYMPSVLIETGFLTNKKEGAFLNSRAGQTQLADAIVNGINNYKNIINIEALESELKEYKVSSSDVMEDFSSVIFKIQLAASSRKIDPSPENFKKLNPITRYQENDLFKYLFGKTSNYLSAQTLRDKAKAEGYTSAFIVAFNSSGDKISIKEALNTRVGE